MRPLLLALGSAALLLASTREARACSPPLTPCPFMFTAPLEGVPLPAGAPAFALRKPADVGALPEPLSLTDSAGAVVPMQVSDDPVDRRFFLLRPLAPFAPGATYHLKFSETCRERGPGGAPELERDLALTTTATRAPLPTSLGSFTLSEVQHGPLTVGDGGGMCASEIQAAYVDLTFQPSAELREYLAMTRLSVSVGGREWSSAMYGSDFGADAIRPPQSEFGNFRSPLRIFRMCAKGQWSGSPDQGIDGTPHTVELRAHVAGAPFDPPPLEANVWLKCPNDPPEEHKPPLTGGGDERPPKSDPGGCASAEGGALGLAAIALRRLRRR